MQISMKVNLGSFIEDRYEKKVKFAEAVLWMTKEISLKPEIIELIKKRGTKTVVFIEPGKEKWTATVEKLLEHGELKQMFQEPQWYFSMDLFDIVKL